MEPYNSPSGVQPSGISFPLKPQGFGTPLFPQDVATFQNQKTLRDEFAMAALTAMLANEALVQRQIKSLPTADTEVEHNANMRSSLLAESYAFADDAIEARKK